MVPARLVEHAARSGGVLNLRGWRLGGNGAATLGALENLEAIEALDLTGNRIGPEGAAALCRLATAGRLDALTSLNLTDNALGLDGLTALLDAPLPKLRSLGLDDNELPALAGQALATAPLLKQLENLSLAENDLGDQGLALLASALGGSAIRELNLGWNGIGAEGISALVDGGALGLVVRLTLSHNPLTDAGIMSLVCCTARPELLGVAWVGLSDAGLTILAESSLLERTTILDLRGNMVGASGAGSLVASMSLKALQTARVEHTRMDDGDLGVLAAAMPRARFIPDPPPPARGIARVCTCCGGGTDAAQPRCQRCHADISVSGLVDVPIAQLSQTPDAPCPHCQASILSSGIRCGHCLSWVPKGFSAVEVASAEQVRRWARPPRKWWQLWRLNG